MPAQPPSDPPVCCSDPRNNRDLPTVQNPLHAGEDCDKDCCGGIRKSHHPQTPIRHLQNSADMEYVSWDGIEETEEYKRISKMEENLQRQAAQGLLDDNPWLEELFADWDPAEEGRERREIESWLDIQTEYSQDPASSSNNIFIPYRNPSSQCHSPPLAESLVSTEQGWNPVRPFGNGKDGRGVIGYFSTHPPIDISNLSTNLRNQAGLMPGRQARDEKYRKFIEYFTQGQGKPRYLESNDASHETDCIVVDATYWDPEHGTVRLRTAALSPIRSIPNDFWAAEWAAEWEAGRMAVTDDPVKVEDAPDTRPPEPGTPNTSDIPPISDDVLPEAPPAERGGGAALEDSKDVHDGLIRTLTPADPSSENKRLNPWGDSVSLDDDSMLDEFFPRLYLDCYTPVKIPEGYSLEQYLDERDEEIGSDCSSNPWPEELQRMWEEEETQKREIRRWIRFQSQLVEEYMELLADEEILESPIDNTVLAHRIPCPLSRPSTPSDFWDESVGDWNEAPERWSHPPDDPANSGSDDLADSGSENPAGSVSDSPTVNHSEASPEVHSGDHPVVDDISHEVEIATVGENMVYRDPENLQTRVMPGVIPDSAQEDSKNDTEKNPKQPSEDMCELDPNEVAMRSLHPDPNKLAPGVSWADLVGYWDDPEDRWPELPENPDRRELPGADHFEYSVDEDSEGVDWDAYWEERAELAPEDEFVSIREIERVWQEEEMKQEDIETWIFSQADIIAEHFESPTGVLAHHERPPSRPGSSSIFHFSAPPKQRSKLAGRSNKLVAGRQKLKAKQPQPPQRHIPFMPQSGEVRAKRKGKTQVRFRPVCQ